MGKTHDDDEIEIDLRELFFALKKRIVVILAALLIGAIVVLTLKYGKKEAQ